MQSVVEHLLSLWDALGLVFTTVKRTVWDCFSLPLLYYLRGWFWGFMRCAVFYKALLLICSFSFFRNTHQQYICCGGHLGCLHWGCYTSCSHSSYESGLCACISVERVPQIPRRTTGCPSYVQGFPQRPSSSHVLCAVPAPPTHSPLWTDLCVLGTTSLPPTHCCPPSPPSCHNRNIIPRHG